MVNSKGISKDPPKNFNLVTRLKNMKTKEERLLEQILFYLNVKVPAREKVRLSTLAEIYGLSLIECYYLIEKLCKNGKVVIFNRIDEGITVTFVMGKRNEN